MVRDPDTTYAGWRVLFNIEMAVDKAISGSGLGKEQPGLAPQICPGMCSLTADTVKHLPRDVG